MGQKETEINGGNLFFTDVGSGAAVMLVHGFPLTHQMWDNQIAELSTKNRVICPDLPGFGRSETSRSVLGMDIWADHLADLLNVLEIEKVVFVGLSMGGYIGWEFARRHRDRLSGLVACNTRAIKDTEQIARGRKMVAASVVVTGAKPVADSMIPKLVGPDADKSVSESIRKMILATDPESIAKGHLAMAGREDARQWLSQIDVPTLLIGGDQDQITPADEMESDSEMLPNSRFECISSAGHMTPMEQPTKFNPLIKDFLVELSGSS